LVPIFPEFSYPFSLGFDICQDIVTRLSCQLAFPRRGGGSREPVPAARVGIASISSFLSSSSFLPFFKRRISGCVEVSLLDKVLVSLS